jgi:RNA polymerase sigma-70 factor (ECF subfamily)
MGRRPDVPDTDFQRWVEPLLDRAAAYAYAILQHREDAEDALQDAALKGQLAFDSYDRSRPFKGWWFAIVRNCCRDLLRKRRLRPATVALDQVESSAQPQDAPVDQEEALGVALKQLSPHHLEILQLRYFGDCSYREIALALDIPEGTVMSRLHAARQALAAIYKRVAQ